MSPCNQKLGLCTTVTCSPYSFFAQRYDHADILEHPPRVPIPGAVNRAGGEVGGAGPSDSRNSDSRFGRIATDAAGQSWSWLFDCLMLVALHAAAVTQLPHVVRTN